MAKRAFYTIDAERGRIQIGSFSMPFPRSKTGRMATGGLFVLGGCLGFLPILGFWMIPLGLIILSHDLAHVRRLRRRAVVKWGRRGKGRHQRRS